MSFQLTDFQIKSYLINFRRYYPGIIEWYDRIKEEVVSGRRSIFTSWQGSEIHGLAITKNGVKSKLCHISVSPTSRDSGLGSTLMNLAVSDMVRNGAQEIHVTTDEEVFRNHAEFFRASGFKLIDWQLNRYRKGASELVWKIMVSNEADYLGNVGHDLNILSNARRFTVHRNAIQGWNVKTRYSTNTLDKSVRDSLYKVWQELGKQDNLLSRQALDSGVLDSSYGELVRHAIKNAIALKADTMQHAIENAKALHQPLMHRACENLKILRRPVLHEALENTRAYKTPLIQQVIENTKALHNPIKHHVKRFEPTLGQEVTQATMVWRRHPISGQSMTPHINVDPKRSTELKALDSVINVEVVPNSEVPNSPEPTTAHETYDDEKSDRMEHYEFNNFPVSVTLLHRPNGSHSFETTHRLRNPSIEEWEEWSLNIKSHRRYLSETELEEYNADKSENDVATDVCELSYNEWEADEKLYNKVILELAEVSLDKDKDFRNHKFCVLDPAIDKITFETKTSVITKLYECYCGIGRGDLGQEQRIVQSLSRNSSSFEVIHVLRKQTEEEDYAFRTTIVSACLSTNEAGKEIVQLRLNLPVAVEFYDRLITDIKNSTVDGQRFSHQTRRAFLAAINPIYKLRVLEPLFNVNAWYFKVDEMNF